MMQKRCTVISREIKRGHKASIALSAGLLIICRQAGLAIFHTLEGFKSDLLDCLSSNLDRQAAAQGDFQRCKLIGEKGAMG